MLGFLKRSGTNSTVAAVQRALTAANLPTELDPAKLSVVDTLCLRWAESDLLSGRRSSPDRWSSWQAGQALKLSGS